MIRLNNRAAMPGFLLQGLYRVARHAYPHVEICPFGTKPGLELNLAHTCQSGAHRRPWGLCARPMAILRKVRERSDYLDWRSFWGSTIFAKPPQIRGLRGQFRETSARIYNGWPWVCSPTRTRVR